MTKLEGILICSNIGWIGAYLYARNEIASLRFIIAIYERRLRQRGGI